MKEIIDWKNSVNNKIQRNLNSDNKRFDLLGNFNKNLEDDFNKTAVAKGKRVSYNRDSIYVSYMQKRSKEKITEIKNLKEKETSDLKKDILNKFTASFIKFNEKSLDNENESLNNFHEIIEFKLITLIKYFKFSMIKLGYHNEKNNVIVYNLLRILNVLLNDENIYLKFSSIINLNLIANLSFSYLKFVFVRTISKCEYNHPDFPLALKILPSIYEQIFKEIYFHDGGKTFDDIYFKISQDFYKIILISNDLYQTLDAKVLLVYDAINKNEKEEFEEDDNTKFLNSEVENDNLLLNLYYLDVVANHYLEYF